MPTMDVFQNSEIISTTTFQDQLMIWKDLDGALHWGADDELRELNAGSIQIWVHPYSTDYLIVYVLSTWTLSINGVVCERKLYEDIKLGNQQVQLEFQDYRFAFY